MAGGIWTTQNKVRPGVYINMKSERKPIGTVGERGIAAFPVQLTWGEPGLIALEAGSFADQALTQLGYHSTDSRIGMVASALAHARKVLLYRVSASTAAKASATLGEFTATAKWGGIRGNDLQIVVENNMDTAGAFDVLTVLEGETVDVQTVTSAEQLVSNSFVDFDGAGGLTATAGTPLTGGTAGSSQAADYSAAFQAFEAEEFNILGVPTDDSAIKQLAVAFTKRLRDSEGVKIQTVLLGYPEADYEGVISLKNSAVSSEGEVIPASDMLWIVTAMEAAANVNESLTYAAIPDSSNVSPKYTANEIEEALRRGELVLTAANGTAHIEQDINTLTSFTADKGKAFSKNRVVRVMDSIHNELKKLFASSFIGKYGNTADGRNLLKAEVINYLAQLQGMGAIQNFDSQADITVLPGNDVDSVLIDLHVQPVDSIEKIYMTVTVQ